MKKKAGQPSGTGEKKRRGRPRKLLPGDTTKIEQAANLTQQGATKKQVAQALGMSVSAFQRSLKKPEYRLFAASVKGAEQERNYAMEDSLYAKGRGFFIEELETEQTYCPARRQLVVTKVKTFRRFVPPDTTAAFGWLNNRFPERWCRKPEENISKPATVIFNFIAVGPDGKQETVQWNPRDRTPLLPQT